VCEVIKIDGHNEYTSGPHQEIKEQDGRGTVRTSIPYEKHRSVVLRPRLEFSHFRIQLWPVTSEPNCSLNTKHERFVMHLVKYLHMSCMGWSLNQQRSVPEAKIKTPLVLMMLLLWVVTPCRLVGRCQRFGETYCLHLQGCRWRQYVFPKRWCNTYLTSLQGVTTQEDDVVIITAAQPHISHH
jgi:hypothetical protein